MGNIHIPGVGEVEVQAPQEPTIGEQHILAALRQIIGQLDMMLRIGVGETSKASIKKRIQENDARLRAAQRVQEAARHPEDPALD